MKQDLVYGIVFSKHDEKLGPSAVCCVPADIDAEIQAHVSTKALNLCSGGKDVVPKGVELITFPSIEMKGLIKCLRLELPASGVGTRKETYTENATLTLLFSDANDAVFYKYIDAFSPAFNEVAMHLQALYKRDASPADYVVEIEGMLARVTSILEELYQAEMPSGGKVAFALPEGMPSAKPTYRFKVIVLGDPEVGKTSLILRFTENVFRKTYIMSIGVNVTTKIVELENAQVEFICWDLAGQSKFDIARRSFYEGANGQFLVFDLTRPSTFESIAKWHRDVKQSLKGDIHGFIIGNKADLTSKIAVTRDEIDFCVQDLGLDYIEASALTGKNVQAAFIKLAQNLVASKKK